MGKMLVFTNAVDGRDEEFNRWYDEVHLAEVLALPVFTEARRFRLADAQRFPEQSHRYLAIYEYEGPAQDALDALAAAAGGFRMSDAMAKDTKVTLVEDVAS
jgi:hypothetical protein